MKYYYDDEVGSFNFRVYDIVSPKFVRGSQAYFKIKYYLKIKNDKGIKIDDMSDGIDQDEMNKGSILDSNSVNMKNRRDFEFVIRKLFELTRFY